MSRSCGCIKKNESGLWTWRSLIALWELMWGFPSGSGVKNVPVTQEMGDVGSIPGSGRLLGGGNGNPFHYSCLKNPMDWGACWAIVRHDWKTRMRAGSQTWSPIQGGPGHVCLGAGWSSLPCAPQVPWCFTFCFPNSLVSRVSHRSWVMRGGIEQWLKLEIWSQTVWLEDQLCVSVDSLFNLSLLDRLVCTLEIL